MGIFLIICFVVSVSFFPSILDSSLLRPNQNFVLLDRSIGFDRSPSRFDVPLDGFR